MKQKNKKNKKGQIIVAGIIFFSIILIFSAALVKYITSYIKSERQNIAKVQALSIAEAGIDKAAYELNTNPSYNGETDTPVGNGSITIEVEPVDSEHKRITSIGTVPFKGGTTYRKIKVTLAIDHTVISFRYGVQAGDGGFFLNNSATVTGNIFSTGPVVGLSDNHIYGDIVSSGPEGLVYGIHSTGNIYAHTIGDSREATIIDQDAHYMAITNTTVNGTSYPNSPDLDSAPLPISDEQIAEWEDDAASGGTISTCDANGNYEIGIDTSLGTKKITCNLIIKNVTLTITGPIWVTGDITIETNALLKMDPSLGSKNVAVIADNPSDSSGSGIITVNQGSLFEGSGTEGSFVFLISQNNSAETGGSTVAISQNQGAAALVAYAAHGLATMNQSANVKEVTAYKISLAQSANVTYDSGLPSTLFESGPGASWVFSPGSYAVEH